MKVVKRRFSVARERLVSFANDATVHGAAGFACITVSTRAMPGSRNAPSQEVSRRPSFASHARITYTKSTSISRSTTVPHAAGATRAS